MSFLLVINNNMLVMILQILYNYFDIYYKYDKKPKDELKLVKTENIANTGWVYIRVIKRVFSVFSQSARSVEFTEIYT
jgi:hypothetical protein